LSCDFIYVYFKGSGVKIPRYPVTVKGKNLPWEPIGFQNAATGKPGRPAGEKPISQETLVYPLHFATLPKEAMLPLEARVFKNPLSFFGLRGLGLEKNNV